MHINNRKIAEKTLFLLTKKSLKSITINEAVSNSKKINVFKTKNDLLKNINQYIDYLLKKKLSSIENSDTQDMLLEVMMIRFDILEKYKKSIIRIFDYFKIHPQKIILLLPSILDSVILITTAAGIKTKSLKGIIYLKAIFIVYFLAFMVWIRDDSISSEKTMTALDKYLNVTEKIINSLI
tara:strand:+ start:11601 stop:12143 length:543 start_codon:yes stop_codon:yes gene_type:complete